MPGVPDYRNTQTPTPHTIPRALETGQIDIGWVVTTDAGWNLTNVTVSRAYDADTVTLPELADVVGTLIDTLKG